MGPLIKLNQQSNWLIKSSLARIDSEVQGTLVVTLSKATNPVHHLAGLPLLLLRNNLVMAMGNLDHTPLHHHSITCLSPHTQAILPSNLAVTLPIGINPLHHLTSSLQVVMIITINSPSNSKILGVLPSQLMGLHTITVSHLPLVIANQDRVMVRKAMVRIMQHNNPGMVSPQHMINNKVMALLPAMAVGVTQHKKVSLPTMAHRQILPKLRNPLLLPRKATLPTNKELLNQVMGLPLPPKRPMEINHNLVMDLVMVPLHLKSQLQIHLCMVNHSHLALPEVMVSQHIPLPRPHLLGMLSQSQALRGHQCNQDMALNHMVLLKVASLATVRLHHRMETVLMVLVILSLPCMLAMGQLHSLFNRVVLLKRPPKVDIFVMVMIVL